MSKQTAVEWLVEQVWKREPLEHEQKVIEQAKAMEREQHGETWNSALLQMNKRAGNIMRAWEDFDDYYNETKGGEQ